jgi:environmental stress-induced protein Ves
MGVSYMHLPNNSHTFRVKTKGDKTGEWFEGDFTVKCVLNQEEIVDIALRTDQYNRGSTSVPAAFALLNRMFAELEVRVVRDKQTGKSQAPTWWVESDHGRLLLDRNVLEEVFINAAKAEKVWADRLQEQAEKAEKESQEKPAVEAPTSGK